MPAYGQDWIVERNVMDQVEFLADLHYASRTLQPVRWVLAVPDEMPVRTIDEFRRLCSERIVSGAGQFTIATELTEVSNRWLVKNGIDARIEFSWGATEAKARNFADAIIEVAETGASLEENSLRIVADVFRSTTRFFANKEVYQEDTWKREKLDGLAHLLTGALRAEDMILLNVVAECNLNLDEILPRDARVVIADKHEGHSVFRALIALSKVSVPGALSALIASGATHAWISPLDVYYAASWPGGSFADRSQDQPG